MGETAFDIGKFYIDGTQQFYKDISAWEHYMFNVTAGTHSFKWEYTKDAVQSNYGDGFFVDNIEFGLGVPCFLANKLVAYSAIDGSATVSWQGNNNSYTLRYKPEGSGSWTTVTGITGQSHTITGLAPGNYDVEVSADCNPGNWISTSFSIFTVQSTANWYGYANAYIDWEGWYTWGEKFVSFSMQNPTNLIAS